MFSDLVKLTRNFCSFDLLASHPESRPRVLVRGVYNNLGGTLHILREFHLSTWLALSSWPPTLKSTPSYEFTYWDHVSLKTLSQELNSYDGVEECSSNPLVPILFAPFAGMHTSIITDVILWSHHFFRLLLAKKDSFPTWSNNTWRWMLSIIVKELDRSQG